MEIPVQFTALPAVVQWLIGILLLPFVAYLAGGLVIFLDPSSFTKAIDGKRGCRFGPLILGTLVLGYLAAPYTCYLLLSSLMRGALIVPILLGVPLGIYLFTVLVAQQMMERLEKINLER